MGFAALSQWLAPFGSRRTRCGFLPVLLVAAMFFLQTPTTEDALPCLSLEAPENLCHEDRASMNSPFVSGSQGLSPCAAHLTFSTCLSIASPPLSCAPGKSALCLSVSSWTCLSFLRFQAGWLIPLQLQFSDEFRNFFLVQIFLLEWTSTLSGFLLSQWKLEVCHCLRYPSPPCSWATSGPGSFLLTLRAFQRRHAVLYIQSEALSWGECAAAKPGHCSSCCSPHFLQGFLWPNCFPPLQPLQELWGRELYLPLTTEKGIYRCFYSFLPSFLCSFPSLLPSLHPSLPSL